jgi:hypothetical protein
MLARATTGASPHLLFVHQHHHGELTQRPPPVVPRGGATPTPASGWQRGGAGSGECPPSPPRSPNSEPRPVPETLIGGDNSPVPDSVGSPNPVGAPWGETSAGKNLLYFQCIHIEDSNHRSHHQRNKRYLKKSMRTCFPNE